MMKCLSAMVLVAVAAPAFAQTESATAADTKADPDRIICERYEETGSRLGSRKVCRTAREWDQQRRAERAEKQAGRSGGNSTGN